MLGSDGSGTWVLGIASSPFYPVPHSQGHLARQTGGRTRTCGWELVCALPCSCVCGLDGMHDVL